MSIHKFEDSVVERECLRLLEVQKELLTPEARTLLTLVAKAQKTGKLPTKGELEREFRTQLGKK